ncbi:5-(carboxyamino)imidazole ribonucleotide synthase [Gemella bergeri]
MIKTILPEKTIGIIGGGQLGRMLAMSAKEMGYKIAILDPSFDCCGRQFSDIFIEASFDDTESIEKLCKISDVVTFEFENISATVLEKLEKVYNIVQSAEVLKITQHRYYEKEFAHRLNIPTVDYIYIEENTNIDIEKTYLMKTVRFGYDGKGQKIISKKEEIEQYTILEELITLDKEISVVAVKDKFDIQIIAVVENEHKNNILFRSKVPTTATEEQENFAIEYTKKILENIEYYGVFTVEFFISKGKVIFNEIAPRVHNSGHITMQSATKSQFRAHIEAICGLRVGKIQNRETTLYNILGQDLEYFKNLITKKQGFLHLYEKEPRKNRKVGHINFYGNIILGGYDEQ